MRTFLARRCIAKPEDKEERPVQESVISDLQLQPFESAGDFLFQVFLKKINIPKNK